ncbi:hypothetical protein HAX54_006824 [Datura stramonium]|uniref:Protein EXORDIUM-like n=1 Tax=Datura stramonium TaxID=4076 RepID=A0ABS8RV92_DATST|nr:hypothetical protein [Datura stramonium]
MASFINSTTFSILLQFSVVLSLIHFSLATRQLEGQTELYKFHYHNGPLLTGKISINLIWYGKFKPTQRAIISDFITSFSSSRKTSPNQPSVATWWKSTDKYFSLPMWDTRIIFELQKCPPKGKIYKFAYIWVGNSETQCPGQCAWPFHQPIYGPQGPALVAPNNDVWARTGWMVMNLASLLAGTVTNPLKWLISRTSFDVPLVLRRLAPVYGSGAYPGYAGNLLVDPTTGASYNARGANGRKFLLPALFDPFTSSCSTLL